MQLNINRNIYKLAYCQLYIGLNGQYHAWLRSSKPLQIKHLQDIGYLQPIYSKWRLPIIINKVIAAAGDVGSRLLVSSPISKLADQHSDHLWLASNSHEILTDILSSVWPWNIKQQQSKHTYEYWRQGTCSDATLLEEFLQKHSSQCRIKQQTLETYLIKSNNTPAEQQEIIATPYSKKTYLQQHSKQYLLSFNKYIELTIGEHYKCRDAAGQLTKILLEYSYSAYSRKNFFHTQVTLEDNTAAIKKDNTAYQISPLLEVVKLQNTTEGTNSNPCQHQNICLHSHTLPSYKKINYNPQLNNNKCILKQHAHPAAILIHHDNYTAPHIIGFVRQKKYCTTAQIKQQIAAIKTDQEQQALSLQCAGTANKSAWKIDNKAIKITADQVGHSSKNIRKIATNSYITKQQIQQEQENNVKVKTKKWLIKYDHITMHNKKQKMQHQHLERNIEEITEKHYQQHSQMQEATAAVSKLTQSATKLNYTGEKSITLTCGAAKIIIEQQQIAIMGTSIEC